MSATWDHTLCLCISLFMAAFAAHLVPSMQKSLREDAKYRFFWLLPEIASCSVLAFAILGIGASPMDSAGLVHIPEWLGILGKGAVLLFFVGIVLQEIAPEGQLLPNVQSVLILAGAFIFGLSFTGYLPVPIKQDAFMVGLAMIIGFGNRNVKSRTRLVTRQTRQVRPSR